MSRKYLLGVLGVAAAALLVTGLWARPAPTSAMPVFAQAYGVACATCHTQVPLLNAYGRYVQNTGYASLDRSVLARALPVWIDASTQYDSSQASGTGQPKYQFGNLAIHGVGYLATGITFHAQQGLPPTVIRDRSIRFG